MENKDFLSYFTELASTTLQIKKTAAFKILTVLHDSRAKTKLEHFEKIPTDNAQITNMLQKYTNGDLGANLSVDANFTIKK